MTDAAPSITPMATDMAVSIDKRVCVLSDRSTDALDMPAVRLSMGGAFSDRFAPSASVVVLVGATVAASEINLLNLREVILLDNFFSSLPRLPHCSKCVFPWRYVLYSKISPIIAGERERGGGGMMDVSGPTTEVE